MTAVSTLIKKLREGKATKEDEVQILDQIAKAAEEGAGYLAALLTPDLIGWVRAQVKADLWPNIMEQFDDLIDHRRTAENKAERLAGNLEDRAKELAQLQADKAEAALAAAVRFQTLQDKYDALAQQNHENVESTLLAERKLRAVRRVAGDALLDDADHVSITALKTALASEPPTFREGSGINPHAFDYAVPR